MIWRTVLEKNDDFDDFRRKDGQAIHEYIAMFDSKYRNNRKEKHDTAIRTSGIQTAQESQYCKRRETISSLRYEL